MSDQTRPCRDCQERVRWNTWEWLKWNCCLRHAHKREYAEELAKWNAAQAREGIRFCKLCDL